MLRVLITSASSIQLSWRNKKKYQYFWVDLFEAILSNFLTFIDHKPRMTEIDNFEFHFYITCLKIKKCGIFFQKIEFSD